MKILMVCMGNICRSPTAHAVLAHMLEEAGLQDEVQVDSAGTHGYHVGAPPDVRSQEHAARRGYDLSAQRAQRLSAQHFECFDFVLVMDDANYDDALAIAPQPHAHKLRKLTDYCNSVQADEVPDPYYGGAAGFEQVLDIVEDACSGIVQRIQNKNAL